MGDQLLAEAALDPDIKLKGDEGDGVLALGKIYSKIQGEEIFCCRCFLSVRLRRRGRRGGPRMWRRHFRGLCALGESAAGRGDGPELGAGQHGCLAAEPVCTCRALERGI